MKGRGKAGTGGRVKKRVERPPDDKVQSERFVDTARKLKVAESEGPFVRAFKKIAQKKRAQR